MQWIFITFRDFTSAFVRARFVGILRAAGKAIGNAVRIRTGIVVAKILTIWNSVVVAVVRIPTTAGSRLGLLRIIRTGIIAIRSPIDI